MTETETKTIKGWAIDRDYFNQEERYKAMNRVGYGMIESDARQTEDEMMGGLNRVTVSTDLKTSQIEDPVRFRIMDEDGEVYYGGAVTAEWLLGANDDAYGILKFGEADVGATDIQFRAKDLPEKFAQRHRDIGCTVTDGGTEWVIVYG